MTVTDVHRFQVCPPAPRWLSKEIWAKQLLWPSDGEFTRAVQPPGFALKKPNQRRVDGAFAGVLQRCACGLVRPLTSSRPERWSENRSRSKRGGRRHADRFLRGDGPRNTGLGNVRRYARRFWGGHVSTSEFPLYPCDFWISSVAGNGGTIVMMLPNGATHYKLSDRKPFPSASAIPEITNLASNPPVTLAFPRSKFSRVLVPPAFHYHFFVRIKLH